MRNSVTPLPWLELPVQSCPEQEHILEKVISGLQILIQQGTIQTVSSDRLKTENI